MKTLPKDLVTPPRPLSEGRSLASYRFTISEREMMRTLAEALDVSETDAMRAVVHKFVKPLVT